MSDFWKKKPSKKELAEIIKIQEERISNLNKEQMKLNVVVRNNKYIKINSLGLEYMVDLEQRLYKAIEILKDTNVEMPTTLLIETIDYALKILEANENK